MALEPRLRSDRGSHRHREERTGQQPERAKASQGVRISGEMGRKPTRGGGGDRELQIEPRGSRDRAELTGPGSWTRFVY